MELDILGHGKRISKIILVKKPTKKRTWKNQTTKTINKFCKKHEKICEFSEKANKCRLSRKEDYETRAKKNHPTNDNIICRKCQKEQEAENFYKNPSNKKGRAYICKKCKKRYDKKRNDTWEALIRSAYRASLYSHGNTKGENKITLKECENLLIKQKYKCNHCRCDLICRQGTVINCSYKRASLDRIDTKKIGYKNNAQWLCVSCNKGKCTMSDEDHKQKFYKLFNIIEYLENLLVKNKIPFDHSIIPDNNN
tara:strand:+ start:793 stop:1551 length:759 start_codon:yes stop_codon:yes gene_type:complete